MLNIADFQSLKKVETPFYYYDVELFNRTADAAAAAAKESGIQIHYSVKANTDRRLLEILSSKGFGADCVSGDEVEFAVACGFKPEDIMFAGVGKTDKEIFQALQMGIGCFTVESLEELAIIGEYAGRLGRHVNISLRINPNIDPHTQQSITTGLYENKFGISDTSFDSAVEIMRRYPSIDFYGLQFHIGSQILEVEEVFALECRKANDIVSLFESKGLIVKNIDLGGGLGVDYDDPDGHAVPDFAGWLRTIASHLKHRPDQHLHVEPGRALAAQCGSLVTRVLYVKKGENRRFLMVDAGMNDLIRPALYGAYHKIENLSAHYDDGEKRDGRIYDVVGPVCETADTFGTQRPMVKSYRGDLIAIRSAGAYGQVMASRYNMRPFAPAVYSDRISEGPRRKDYFARQ